MLAIRAGALGDTLLTFPALGALVEAVGPRGAVELLGRHPQAALARESGLATVVHDVDRARFVGLFGAGAGAGAGAEDLSRFLAGFDVIVSWADVPGLAALYPGEIVRGSPLPPAGVHAAEHLVNALRHVGVGIDLDFDVSSSPHLAFTPSSEAERGAASFLSQSDLAGRPFVAIHPSSGSRDKNWHSDGFFELGRLARDAGYQVVWIEGEGDEAVVSALAKAAPGALAKRLRLDVLAALLRRASVYVGNDSGVTHLAAFSGAPTIAIFGPTDPRSWAPVGKRVAVVNFGQSAAELWGIATARYLAH